MKTKINAKRTLQFESLENRELLSVSPLGANPYEQDGIPALYADAVPTAAAATASAAETTSITNLSATSTGSKINITFKGIANQKYTLAINAYKPGSNSDSLTTMVVTANLSGVVSTSISQDTTKEYYVNILEGQLTKAQCENWDTAVSCMVGQINSCPAPKLAKPAAADIKAGSITFAVSNFKANPKSGYWWDGKDWAWDQEVFPFWKCDQINIKIDGQTHIVETSGWDGSAIKLLIPTSSGYIVTDYKLALNTNTGKFTVSGLSAGTFAVSFDRADNISRLGTSNGVKEVPSVYVSSLSNTITVGTPTKTPYTAPTNVQAALVAGSETTKVNVSWKAVAEDDAARKTGYAVQYKETGTAAWKTATVTPKAANTYAAGDTVSTTLTLTAGKTYEIQVYAKADSGKTGNSDSEAVKISGNAIRTYAVAPTATLKQATSEEGKAADGNFRSDRNAAINVTNWNKAGGLATTYTAAAGKTKEITAVNKLTVTYTIGKATPQSETLTWSGSSWAGGTNVSFKNGVILIKGLESSTSYAVTAQFLNTASGKEATSTAAGKATAKTTLAAWTTDPAITNVTLGGSGAKDTEKNSATVKWSEAKDDASSPNKPANYTITAWTYNVSAKPGKEWTAAAKKTAVYSANGFVITGLKANTEYYFTVEANKNAGHVQGTMSAREVSGTVYKATTYASAPKPTLKLTAGDDNLSFAVTNWNAKNGLTTAAEKASYAGSVAVDTLKVSYGGKEATLTLSGSSWTGGSGVTFVDGVIKISNLEPSTAYTVEVIFSGKNTSPKATADAAAVLKNQKTLNTSWNKVATVTATVGGSNRLTVEWSEVTAKKTSVAATDYTIQVLTKDAKTGLFTKVAVTKKAKAADHTGFVVDKLQQNTEYQVSVFATEVKGKYTANLTDKALSSIVVTNATLTVPKVTLNSVANKTVTLNIPYTGGKATDLNLDDLTTESAMLKVTVRDSYNDDRWSATLNDSGKWKSNYGDRSSYIDANGGVQYITYNYDKSNGLLTVGNLPLGENYFFEVQFSGKLSSNGNVAVSEVVKLKDAAQMNKLVLANTELLSGGATIVVEDWADIKDNIAHLSVMVQNGKGYVTFFVSDKYGSFSESSYKDISDAAARLTAIKNVLLDAAVGAAKDTALEIFDEIATSIYAKKLPTDVVKQVKNAMDAAGDTAGRIDAVISGVGPHSSLYYLPVAAKMSDGVLVIGSYGGNEEMFYHLIPSTKYTVTVTAFLKNGGKMTDTIAVTTKKG